MWTPSAGICRSKFCPQTQLLPPTCLSSQGPIALIFERCALKGEVDHSVRTKCVCKCVCVWERFYFFFYGWEISAQKCKFPKQRHDSRLNIKLMANICNLLYNSTVIFFPYAFWGAFKFFGGELWKSFLLGKRKSLSPEYLFLFSLDTNCSSCFFLCNCFAFSFYKGRVVMEQLLV